MGEPITGDDGGSIRIRVIKDDPRSVGELTALFDVKDLSPGRRGSEDMIVMPPEKPYKNVQIWWQNSDGWIQSLYSQDERPSWTKVLISSEFGHKVLVEKVEGDDCKLKITVYCDKGEPILASRQHKKRRCYVITNSGPIQKVEVDDELVYDTDAGGRNSVPMGRLDQPIYTNVVLT